MFGLSFDKLLVIAVVALLVIGPERLPAVARTAGLLFRRFQRFSQSIRSDFQRELHNAEIMAMAQEMRREEEAMKQEVRQQLGYPEFEHTEHSIRPPATPPLPDPHQQPPSPPPANELPQASPPATPPEHEA